MHVILWILAVISFVLSYAIYKEFGEIGLPVAGPFLICAALLGSFASAIARLQEIAQNTSQAGRTDAQVLARLRTMMLREGERRIASYPYLRLRIQDKTDFFVAALLTNQSLYLETLPSQANAPGSLFFELRRSMIEIPNTTPSANRAPPDNLWFEFSHQGTTYFLNMTQPSAEKLETALRSSNSIPPTAAAAVT